MPYQLKVLIIVMVVTTISFMIAKSPMSRLMSAADFAVRRNVWLALNLAAFAIPSYWVYVLVAFLVLTYGLRRDSNPAALYVFLLLAMAPLGLELPTLGVVNRVFLFNHFRLLSLLLLVPLAMRLVRRPRPAARGWSAEPLRLERVSDMLILAYAIWQIGLLVPHESVTATLRRALLFGLDMLLPYYVVSRACRSRDAIVDVMAAFALALAVLVPLAIYEVARSSLLYAVLQEAWGTGAVFNYLRRGDYLRAQVTAGHSIVLGYGMAMALGFWLYLQAQVSTRNWRWFGFAVFAGGLVLPFARGPWVGAMLIGVLFLGLRPNSGTRLIKALGGAALGALVVLISPYSGKIIDALPFIGTLGGGTIDYRQRLAEQSWALIQQNPFFGVPGYLAYLEDLRQGQGIIDLVNAYASIALGYGLVGLGLFLAFFIVIVWRCLKALRGLAVLDPDLSRMGASIVACVLGGLAMIATVNLYLSVAYFTWALAGLAVSYLVVATEALRAQAADRSVQPYAEVSRPQPWPAASARR